MPQQPPPTGLDYLIVFARDRGAPEAVQKAFQDVALGKPDALYDLKRTPKQQLEDYELTALQIFVASIEAALEYADAQSQQDVMLASCRLATRWRSFLKMASPELFGG